jgi:hypothetical protein
VAKTALYGQPEAMANLIRRTLMVTRAPILTSLRRMVPQVASLQSQPTGTLDQDVSHAGLMPAKRL